MKAIVNTTISLGLISLPVGIAKATEEDDVKFNLGNAKGEKLTQQYVDPAGKVIPTEDRTRTFNGKVIPQTALDTIAEQTKFDNMTISKIEKRDRFIQEAHRVTGSYFIQSTKKTGNVNAYKLFAASLLQLESVAVTKVCFRGRQQLFIIWPDAEGNLRGSTMSFASDQRSADDNVKAHHAGTYSPAELEMATQLLTALSQSDADPLAEAEDEAVPLRKALVEQYMNSETLPEATPAVAQPEQNAALADALAASLAAIKATA